MRFTPQAPRILKWFIDFFKNSCALFSGLCRQLMLLKVTLEPITSSGLYIDNSSIDAERITEVERIPDFLYFLFSLRNYFLFINVSFGNASNSL